MKKKKVVVIGLDAAPPKLVFEMWKSKLPTLSRLMDNGVWGPLRSCIPPITVPAWMCMMTGKDPGQLGIYGFRERDKKSFTKSIIANSSYIREKTVWDILGNHGKKSIVIGVPPTYPVKKINGTLVSDFLTPSIQNTYTYPKSLAKEIKKIVGNYLLDTKFRVENKKKLLKEIFMMTEKRFKIAKYLLQNKPWDFFMMVEIGTDRIQHAFWNKTVIFDYYRLVDQKIGELLQVIPKDTAVFVVSDHGAKKMDGAFCINEWLIQEGYLVLKSYPKKISTLEEADVDWSKTKAYAWGGYYARVFLNVKQKDFKKGREILRKKLLRVTDEKGKPLKNIVEPPEKLYTTVRGNPADLFAIFGNLSWRAAGTIGHKTNWIFENDIGPDDAVHDWNGIFIKYDPTKKKKKQIKGLQIYNVFKLILKEFRL